MFRKSTQRTALTCNHAFRGCPPSPAFHHQPHHRHRCPLDRRSLLAAYTTVDLSLRARLACLSPRALTTVPVYQPTRHQRASSQAQHSTLPLPLSPRHDSVHLYQRSHTASCYSCPTTLYSLAPSHIRSPIPVGSTDITPV
jgi:hypothetical protein